VKREREGKNWKIQKARYSTYLSTQESKTEIPGAATERVIISMASL